MLVAGGIAWGVRIIFTLILGKEALGFGDVHILAAAGAVTGWVVVLLGFFVAAFLAVIGIVLLLAFKRSRAIPFGPWLALGILAASLALDPLLRFLSPAIRGWDRLLTG
jgi:leader peptidase (prepilin peptidase)/N-methyltransferase